MLRTITADYARSLVHLADSIEVSPDCPAIRERWVEELRDTCPLDRKGSARGFLMRVLDSVSLENPPQRHVDLLRVLSYVVKKSPVVE